MPVTKSDANWKSVPTSKLSKTPLQTEPEKREMGTKAESPEKANKILKREFE